MLIFIFLIYAHEARRGEKKQLFRPKNPKSKKKKGEEKKKNIKSKSVQRCLSYYRLITANCAYN